jgi:hypothetical protein
MDTIQPLNVPGARQSVEIENPQGIFYKIRVGGEVIKRSRGGWPIPLRNGDTALIRSKGLIPGFQVLELRGERIFDMGEGVGRLERITMFAPILLALWVPFGVVIGLVLFFFGIPLVKNLQVPRPARIALPIVNFLVVAALLTLLTGRIGIWG